MSWSVLFIDDDRYAMHVYIRALEAMGFVVDSVRSTAAAIEKAKARTYDLFVVDVMMSPGNAFSQLETQGGYKTGIALSREIAALHHDAVIVGFTLSTDEETAEWFAQGGRFHFFQKQEWPPSPFARKLTKLMDGVPDTPNVFIIHGHDRVAALELKNYLQNILNFDEPTILAEKASGGKTIIEKFESYADDSDIVFALFTPDDFADASAKSGRARQNVVFEYGYFMGRLGRRSGKVFLLHKGSVELPSDLHGIVYIDITNGIESAGETMRKELDHLSPSR